MKAILLLFLIMALNRQAPAQSLTTETPYDLTSTMGTPFSLPIRFDLTGRVSLRLTQVNATVFPVFGHVAFERQRYEFIPALSGLKSDWQEADASVPRLKVQRFKVEGGVGPGAAMKLLSGSAGVSLGLVPFKGASWESRVFREPTRGRYSLPLERSDWDEWSIGEGRDYQVYGGLSVSLGLSLLGQTAAQVFRTTQERWTLSIEKVSSKHLRVRVRRDDWRKNGYVVGPLVANWERAALAYFDQERTYLLDMQSPLGREALKALWAGRLDQMQTAAAVQEEGQVRTWYGTYRARYLGVPYIFGQSTARVDINSWETADGGRALDVLNLQQRNHGLLREADPQVWTVVHDATDKTMYFLAISQSIKEGSRGVQKKLGFWMEGIGLELHWPTTRDRDFLDARLMFALPTKLWSKLGKIAIDTTAYQNACASFLLKCRKQSSAQKAIRRWDEIRQGQAAEFKPMQFAEFLIRHPVLWGLLLEMSGEVLNAEFMAHGEHWLPVQKILSTR